MEGSVKALIEEEVNARKIVAEAAEKLKMAA